MTSSLATSLSKNFTGNDVINLFEFMWWRHTLQALLMTSFVMESIELLEKFTKMRNALYVDDVISLMTSLKFVISGKRWIYNNKLFASC